MTKQEEISFEDGKRKLPDRWQLVKLSEISRLVSGGTPHRGTSENFKGTIPWVKTLDLNCNVVRETEECISESAFEQIRGELLPVGTVMVAMYGGGGTIGKSGILGLPATTNQAICSILPNPNAFVPELLHAWLILIRPEWMQYSSGNRRDPNINKGVVENMSFPLPPLDEQKRIAAILSEKMEGVEKARKEAIAQLEAAKDLPASYLRAVFNSPEAQQWERKRLGDMCDFIGGMQPPKHTFKYEPFPGYVRLVQIQDFRKSDVAVYIPAKEAKRSFDESDVMIGRYGPPIFQILRGLSGAYNVALIKTVPKADLLKDFLYYLLQEPSIQEIVTAQSQRSAGQTGVQKEFVENLIVPIPPMNEQKCIAATLTQQMTEVKKLRKTLEKQLEAINQLPAAFLRQAFNGEL
ncbi:MAG: restriction endonuclease subunit S [Tolypothrix carrinoi HA7290-LM1]|nr:restriction endonuclease subunit S [Tolypothrix carrinoi HA7290-LM1]